MPPATFQPKSMNSKLSDIELIPYGSNRRFQTKAHAPFVSSTYVSIEATCPSACRFKDAGCYVQVGNAALPMQRLDEGARETAQHPNVYEAELIDQQWTRGIPQDGARGGRDMRMHVGGDIRDEEGAKALATACDRWLGRGGGMVWSYTHRWRELSPALWAGAINVLASVETAAEAFEAIARGYTPSFTMSSFESKRRHKVGGVDVIPCPAQTRGVKCIQCRLCFAPLPKGRAIGFEWHGRGSAGKRKLDVIQREHHGQQTMGFA